MSQLPKYPNVLAMFMNSDGVTASPVSAANPLPTTGGGGGGSSSLADSLVVDAAGVYWILRDTGAAITYVNLSTGVVGTPTAPVTPASIDKGYKDASQSYTVITAVTGGAVGDILEHLLFLQMNASPPTIAVNTWVNVTQGTVLASAPANTSLNAIDDNVQATIVGTLPAFAATPTVVLGAGAAAVGTVTIGSALPAGTNAIGSVTQSGTWSVTVGSALPAGTNSIGTVILGAGTAAIGNITNITGTVSLPTGAATATLQNTINTSLGTINTTLGSPLQANGIVKTGLSQQGSTTLTDISGSVTTGGTAQNAQAATATRVGFELQNTSNAGFWFSTTATATGASPSYYLAPGQTYTSPVNSSPTGAISVFGATTGQTWTGRAW